MKHLKLAWRTLLLISIVAASIAVDAFTPDEPNERPHITD
jgi:hypothetical protein